MNSFTLTAVGYLARNPEVVAKGDTTHTRFCLIGNDYGGKDEVGAPREIVTSLWFVAFGALGEAIARNSRKGDQLMIEARVRSNIWTDKQGERQHDHSFVVQGFRFGAPGRAKRDELSGRDWGGRRDLETTGASVPESSATAPEPTALAPEPSANALERSAQASETSGHALARSGHAGGNENRSGSGHGGARVPIHEGGNSRPGAEECAESDSPLGTDSAANGASSSVAGALVSPIGPVMGASVAEKGPAIAAAALPGSGGAIQKSAHKDAQKGSQKDLQKDSQKDSPKDSQRDKGRGARRVASTN
jgi:single-strand DNA-binding protein